MPIFAEASTLVKAVEIHLVSETESKIQLLGYVKRLVLIPGKFLKMGIGEKAKDTFVWAFLSSTLMAMGFLLIGNSEFAKVQVMNVVVFAASIISMFVVVFALPSMYGNSGVSPENVRFVVEFLGTRGFLSVSEIELLKKSIKPFEDRARSRVTALKWLVGLLWTSFLYVWSKSIEVAALSSSEQTVYAFTLAGLSAGLLVAYLCVWGYEASLDKLFRAIEFGCNDFSCLVGSNSEVEVKQSVGLECV